MRETMKATSSSSSFAVYITLCITAVVHISYGDSRETCQPCPVPTTPPIEHVLPLERKAGNHIDLICPASEKYGKVFLHGFIFNVTCNDGYTFGKFDGSPVFTVFVNGTWTPTVPECKRMCKPLKDVRCRYKGEEINCSNSVPVGTEATCRTGHMPARTSVVCNENGEWSYDLVDCPTSACGRKNSSESISPWFFALLVGDPPNQIFICFGTLISRHIVLTSAYCGFLHAENRVRYPETLKVIAANQWFNKKPHGATLRVRHISVHPLYFGGDTHYAANVALIDLESSVPFTPACVNWDLEFAIAERESASIILRDNSTLQEVVVPCESYVNCVSALEKEKRHYLTRDKFCVEISNGSDKYFRHYSGGLVVQRNGVSYVKGVVSHYFNSKVGRKYVATNLSDVGLIHWLRQTKLSFDAHHIDN